jgi:hypothetical protein
MFVHVGQGYFGAVDQMPGGYYVVTRCWHVNFVPIPGFQSYLVTEGHHAKGRFAAVKIPLNGKSIWYAYIRMFLGYNTLIWPIVALGFFCMWKNGVMPELAPMLILVAVSVLCPLSWWLSHRVSRASPLRALKIGLSAGFGPEVIAQQYASAITNRDLEQLKSAIEANLLHYQGKQT